MKSETAADPRVRGEALGVPAPVEEDSGRSPRARGSQLRGRATHLLRRPIPACAGKPVHVAPQLRDLGADPRVRGEACAIGFPTAFRAGRSPRARGSLRHEPVTRRDLGPIPACAGKPAHRVPRHMLSWADPRVRGEAFRKARPISEETGRSPRARGSLLERAWSPSTSGPIPACAGKPPRSRRAEWRRTADPRVRGEATQETVYTPYSAGRSPRARGSLPDAPQDGGHPGPIPACAGKPPTRTPRRRDGRADPRVRGEASRPQPCGQVLWGRSPRARGSPPRLMGELQFRRPIPACAGKPHPLWSVATGSTADPRVRGEADVGTRRRRSGFGRSPRARGSLTLAAAVCDRGGPIPACAGKPERARARRGRTTADPRVRGEALAPV